MNELRDKVPFNCIITGPTNCGKTRFLIEQLRGPFRNVFEYIFLICPTYANNKTYHRFAHGDKRFFVSSPVASNSDNIDEILKDVSEVFSGNNTLVILDDCAVSKDLKQRSNKFIDLAFSGRHEGLSIWVLTQQLTSIAKPFRENVACVVTFHNPSVNSTKTLFEDYGGDLDAETRKEFIKLLKTEKYSRLCLCLRFPFECYLEIPSTTL